MRQKGSEILLGSGGVALGSSISKEEKAVGVGLSLVPGPHLPAPHPPPSFWTVALTPMQGQGGTGWTGEGRGSELAERCGV